jgi:hypothetical protein
MKKSMYLLISLLILLLSSFVLPRVEASTAALPGNTRQIDGMILRAESSGDITISKGSEDHVEVGTIFYVTRVARPVGRIKVVSVNQYNSVCHSEELFVGQKYERGDVVSTKPFTHQHSATATERKVSADRNVSPGRDTTSERMTSAGRDASDNTVAVNSGNSRDSSAEQRFKDFTRRYTRNYHFKQRGRVDTLGPFSLIGAFTPTIARLPHLNSTWDKVSVGVSAVYTMNYVKQARQMYKEPSVHVELTYWSPEYLDAFADYQAYQESITDPAFINAAKENIFRQKGMDRFYVFQVRIINPGPGYVQLAPFTNRFYIKAERERTLIAEHYDQSLDASLGPNQVANGYVYFRKFDNSGMPTLFDGAINVELHNIMGHSKRTSFK